MVYSLPSRGEILISGIGGGGILTSGAILAQAATTKYTHVCWFPSYDISKRGGKVECTVIFDNQEISSPLLDKANIVVISEPAQLEAFLGRIRPGGILITEVAGLPPDLCIKDATIVKVPAIKTAIAIGGSSRGANMVLLGALIEATRILPAELIDQEMRKTYLGKEKVLNANLQAFYSGIELFSKRQ